MMAHDDTNGLTLHQRVALRRDLPEHGLHQGDVATLVEFVDHPEDGERGCVLEVFNAVGDSIGVAAVPISAVEPLRADEVLTVRSVRGAA